MSVAFALRGLVWEVARPIPADLDLIAYNYYDTDARAFTGSRREIVARFDNPVWRLSPLGIAQCAVRLVQPEWSIAGPMPTTALLAALDYHVEINTSENRGRLVIEHKPFTGYADEICAKYDVPVWKFTAIGLRQIDAERCYPCSLERWARTATAEELEACSPSARPHTCGLEEA
jgi:hypothetical protein